MELLRVDVEGGLFVCARDWDFGGLLRLLGRLSLRCLWLGGRAHGRLSWLVCDSRTVDRGHSPLSWHLTLLHLLDVVRHGLRRIHNMGGIASCARYLAGDCARAAWAKDEREVVMIVMNESTISRGVYWMIFKAI